MSVTQDVLGLGYDTSDDFTSAFERVDETHPYPDTDMPKPPAAATAVASVAVAVPAIGAFSTG